MASFLMIGALSAWRHWRRGLWPRWTLMCLINPQTDGDSVVSRIV